MLPTSRDQLERAQLDDPPGHGRTTASPRRASSCAGSACGGGRRGVGPGVQGPGRAPVGHAHAAAASVSVGSAAGSSGNGNFAEDLGQHGIAQLGGRAVEHQAALARSPKIRSA